MSAPMDRVPLLSPAGASRRAFLQRGAVLSLAGSAAPWALSLAAMGEAAAQSATDYKAMVCVFLYGGNDYANTLVPYDNASYAAYSGFRPNLAIAQSSLVSTLLNPATPLAGGLQYALTPTAAPLVPVFDAGRMAVLLNIGTLIGPTTKAQYNARSVPLPPKLFSHNDQQSYWQASSPEGATSGWGGRLGDLFASGNGNATFTCVNVSGNAVFLSGHSAVQYQVRPSGSVPVNGIKSALYGSAAASQALSTIMTAGSAHLFESEYVRVTQRALAANEQLTSALAGSNITTAFPTGNALADQLKMVARMIAARSSLAAKRQVFFVSIGGFDTHDGLANVHPALWTTVSSAMAAFDQAMVDLGTSASVTAFTASDFGRTLLSNNDGSDHGWGSVHLVTGGAVRGKAFYGTPPVLANNGPDDVGQGRLLPTTSIEQFGATLAAWFGLSASDQLAVLPNLANFSTRNLGFV